MLCTVCHGSGISPGSERIGGLQCGACNGSGHLPNRSDTPSRSYGIDDSEVDHPGWDSSDRVSASERKEAFKRHLRAITEMSGTRSYALWAPLDDTDTNSGPLNEIEAMRRMIALDSRMTPMMVRVTPGNAAESVIDDLEEIGEGYRNLLDRIPDHSQLVERDTLLTRIGQCTYYCGNAAESLRDDTRALEYFCDALDQFQTADNADEINRTEQKISDLERHMTDGLDDHLVHLQQRLLGQAEGSSERAETLIALGYACLKAGDSYQARDHFEQAEKILEARKILTARGNPDAGSLALGLMESMQAIMNPEVNQSGANANPIVDLLKQRSLFQQLYNGLASAYLEIDPDKSAHYNRLAADMDSRTSSQDFGSQAMSLLQGRFKDLLK